VTRRIALRAAMAVFLALVLAGCRSDRGPTPAATVLPTAPRPTTEAAPLPTATHASPVVTATPPAPASAAPAGSATGLPAGWQRESNEQLSIAIPPGWTSVNLSGVDAQAAYDEIKRNDPHLAGIIGSPEALQGMAFWAFGPVEAEFTDNLNIRRSPLGAQRVTGMQEVIDALLPEYQKLGLQVTSTDPALQVHGYPAARITYSFMMSTAEGQAIEVRGRQVIVATDSDLWILSFSTTPGREGAQAGVFEQSAQSFEPK